MAMTAKQSGRAIRYTRGMRIAIALAVLSALVGCKSKPVTCSTFEVEHGSVPSRLPTSFDRDLATAKFSSCSDGRTYTVQCRHGSIHTECECAIDGVATLKIKGHDRLPDDRAAAFTYANASCEWNLR
jgi:hypothetical protein